MWAWTLNWGEIRRDIVVGSCPSAPADIDRICEEAGASALLSLQTDECRAALGIDHGAHLDHAARRGVVLLNAPMRDFDPVDQRDRLPDAVAALRRLLADGHRAYVHCTAGINRAPLTVLGYLTFVEGMTVDDAMALILRGRPQASPYWEPYHGCREDTLARTRAQVELRAWTLAQRDPSRSADSNWLQAEREVLSEALAVS
jgi:hypothetical protein